VTAEDAAGNNVVRHGRRPALFALEEWPVHAVHAGRTDLSSDFVWALHPEPDGALWIGTYGGGLTRLKDGRAVSWHHPPGPSWTT